MLKQRILLLGGLLALSIVGQVLLRPCLGTPERAGDAADTSALASRSDPSEANDAHTTEDDAAGTPMFSDDTDFLQGQLWRQFFYMVGFVALVGMGAWLVCRKLGGGSVGGGRTIRIGETVRLGPRKSLHLIRVGSKTLLVGATGDQLSLLADVSDQIPVDEGKTDA